MQNNIRIRLDAYKKVTGKALYVDDMTFPNMLHLATVHAPYPSAEILGVDVSRALKADGVVGVYTAKDCPGEVCHAGDKPVLVERFVRSHGDGVALVAAETEQAARAAAKLVDVRYQELSAVFDVEEALKSGAHLVHGDTTESNVFFVQEVVKNDVASGFAEADVVVEGEYKTPRHCPGAIEPDAVIAVPEGDGLIIHCASKGPYGVKPYLLDILNLPEDKLHLRHAEIGGTFGGKEWDTTIIGARAGMAALLTGRPCKLLWSREECMMEGTKRHPFTVRYKIGAKRDGKITALEFTGYTDIGAYKSKSIGVIRRASIEGSGPYNLPNVYINIKGVHTNNVYCCAVRGFGSPQVYFGLESTMNDLAKALGIPPLELRKINALRDGDVSANSQVLTHVGIGPCLNKLEEVFDCTSVKDKIRGDKAYGRGIACQIRGDSHGGGMPDLTGADLHVSRDGSIELHTAITEMGQGTHTGMANVACDLLGLPWERFSVAVVDTAYSPYSSATVGSRGTISGANAVFLAFNDLIRKMSPAAAEKMGMQPEDITYSHGCFYGKGGYVKASFDEVVACIYEGGAKELAGIGRYVAPETFWDVKNKRGNGYYSYSYGAGGAEVEVDLVTGKVEVRNIVILHDAGNIVNYEGAKGQLEGGAAMTLGHCLSENLEVEKGKVKTLNFDSYLMPTSMDIHTLTGRPEELVRGATAMGTHGVGEGASVLVGVMIANALEDALGVRIHEQPFSLERVRAAIEEMRAKQK